MAETFYWGVEAMKALISLWGNDNIRSILEEKNEEKTLTYQQYGMCRSNGSLFYKKSLNMGPVFTKNP